MKNNRGQTNVGLGLIITMFIAVLVGVIFFQVIAQTVGESTNTITIENESIDTVVSGEVQYMDYKALSDVVIYNETGGIVPDTNYVVTNNVINDGELSVSILPDTTATYESAWQVSATAQPTTYISDSGARSVAGLIVIMFALAIAIVAISPTLKSKMFG